MTRAFAFLLGCVALLAATLCACDGERPQNSPAPPDTSSSTSSQLRLYAAASLAQVLEEIFEENFDEIFEASLEAGLEVDPSDRRGDFSKGTVRIISAASSTLARQLEAGASPGVFVSANAAWMSHLAEGGHLLPQSRRALIGNRLLLVRPRKASDAGDPVRQVGARELADLLDAGLSPSGRLCIADPDHVPAGIYARSALVKSGLWAGLRDRVLPGADARRTLWYLARGACDSGIVYRTDVLRGNSTGPIASIARAAAIAPVALIAADLHEPIVYEIAIVRGAPPAARDLCEFLFSPAAQEVFQSFGFVDVRR